MRGAEHTATTAPRTQATTATTAPMPVTGPETEQWASLGIIGLAIGGLLVMWSYTRFRRDRLML